MSLPPDDARREASGWAGPLDVAQGPKGWASLPCPSRGPPFPRWPSPPTWETTECICLSLVSDLSATSLPVYPEHCHQPAWMTHPNFNPALISESLGSLARLPISGCHPQKCWFRCSGQGLGIQTCIITCLFSQQEKLGDRSEGTERS